MAAKQPNGSGYIAWCMTPSCHYLIIFRHHTDQPSLTYRIIIE